MTQRGTTKFRTPARLTVAASIVLLSICLALGGCSQTVDTEQAGKDDVEEAMGLRAELEAGCVTEGYTQGTPEFQSCVGRASIPYSNAGFSKAKVIHKGVKRGPEMIRVYNAGRQLARTAAVISDARLKRDVVRVGRLQHGLPLYRFRYLGGSRQFVGVLAQEVERTFPAAVQIGADGYLRVDYRTLGFRLMTWDAWVESASKDRAREIPKPVKR